MTALEAPVSGWTNALPLKPSARGTLSGMIPGHTAFGNTFL